jgi:hypothetical protein
MLKLTMKHALCAGVIASAGFATLASAQSGSSHSESSSSSTSFSLSINLGESLVALSSAARREMVSPCMSAARPT